MTRKPTKKDLITEEKPTKIDPITKEEKENLPEAVLDQEIKKVEKSMNVIGHVRQKVYQKSSFIKTKSLRSHPCNYELPDDIRKYLNNKWWGSNVYLKGEERLVKHNADMKMIEKLKEILQEIQCKTEMV